MRQWTSAIAETKSAYVLLASAAASCALCSLLFNRVIDQDGARWCQRQKWKALPGWRKLTCAADVVSLLHALVVSPIALYAFYEIIARADDDVSVECGHQPNLATTPSPLATIVATGIACGNFLYDCYLMLVFVPETNMRFAAAGGAWVMWLHHFLSILVWPYCVLTNRGTYFVTWMLTTEVSNIGQNAFSLSEFGGMNDKGRMAIGIGWMLSFFIVRMLPALSVLGTYYRLLMASGACGFALLDRCIGLVTVPIPIVLNAVWFKEMLVVAYRRLSADSEKKRE